MQLSKSCALLTAALGLVVGVLGQVDVSKEYRVPAESKEYVPRVLIGCYNETLQARALTHYPGVTNGRMSPQLCEDHCRKYNGMGSVLFGLTRTNQCQCGDALSNTTFAVPSFECRTACPADNNAFCGGINRVNVYGPKSMLMVPAEPSVNIAQGCWQEVSATRRMNDFPLLTSPQMTVDMCHTHCSAYQSNFMAIRSGNECLCGQSTDNLTKVGEGLCSTVCRGGHSLCGGPAARTVSLWKLDTSKFPSIGQWGDLVKFPVVPVAVALIPENGNLLIWSAAWKDDWTMAGGGKTQTAIWNVKTNEISEATVQHTKHDMFCPGISLDQDGRIIVSGGSTEAKVSIYNGRSNVWVGGSDMKIPRGYQTSVTTSDGTIFTIGGSFGAAGVKDGETYFPTNNTWLKLPNSPARRMWMSGNGGFTGDSHAWLFAWKSGWVFQAGPSKQMNWYQSRSNGGFNAVGNRGVDPDSMCGINVMYDAIQGKIFTLGGSPSYSGSAATSNAHIITLGEPGSPVNVKKVRNGEFRRGFANGVILPDGKVMILGGMTNTILFSNANPVYFPEIFDPETETYTKLRPHSTPRNYHSTALLMPDATIFHGGGGLCGTGCVANHFDGQFFQPPYLFEADGTTLSTRPVIESVSTDSLYLSSKQLDIAIKMDSPSAYSFSLIRMSTVTHAINSDQRRIPLKPQGSGTDFTVSVPGDSGITVPGPYLLFAINEKGTPSVAKTIFIRL